MHNGVVRFHVLGDSLAAGVGCTRQADTVGHVLANRLRAAGRTVDLRVQAVPGARSAGLATQVRAAVAAGADLALIIIGANDLIGFVPPQVAARLLHDAVSDLRRSGAQVVVVTAPDLGVVSHVPPAFRPFVSSVSEDYARTQADAVMRAGGVIVPADRALNARFATDLTLFSADRFHPSAAGYRLVADVIAPHLERALLATNNPTASNPSPNARKPRS